MHFELCEVKVGDRALGDGKGGKNDVQNATRAARPNIKVGGGEKTSHFSVAISRRFIFYVYIYIYIFSKTIDNMLPGKVCIYICR